jgi:HSP20 family protein
MTTLTQNDAGLPVGIPDWTDGFPVALPAGTSFPIRVEDYRGDGQYVLRAELPGVDPEKDITVTVSGGAVAIRAERHETAERRHHAEFRYGLFARTIRLPMDADGNHIQATYGNGILQITATLRTALSEQPDHHVPVMVDHHIKPT